MKREDISTFFIRSYLGDHRCLLDHLLLFESVLYGVVLKWFWKHAFVMILVSIRTHTKFCLLKNVSKWKYWCIKCFVVSKQETRSNLPTQRSLVFFYSSFRCCYLTIDLVRSSIIGCEGMGAGHLYSHRRQPMRRFSNCRKGLRSFYKKQHRRVIEGLRSFIEALC